MTNQNFLQENCHLNMSQTKINTITLSMVLDSLAHSNPVFIQRHINMCVWMNYIREWNKSPQGCVCVYMWMKYITTRGCVCVYMCVNKIYAHKCMHIYHSFTYTHLLCWSRHGGRYSAGHHATHTLTTADHLWQASQACGWPVLHILTWQPGDGIIIQNIVRINSCIILKDQM